MSKQREELREFMDTKAGVWFLEQLEVIRRSNHDKAEQDPDKSAYYAAKASGNGEVVNWIKSSIVNPKS